MVFPRLSVSVELMLRVGLAFAFLYPAVTAWFDPYLWTGYFPAFVYDIAGSHILILLHIFGVVEIAIAVWLLVGTRLYIPAGAAAVLLLLIIALNLGQFSVLFRDIPILLMALALLHSSLDTKKAP